MHNFIQYANEWSNHVICGKYDYKLDYSFVLEEDLGQPKNKLSIICIIIRTHSWNFEHSEDKRAH